MIESLEIRNFRGIKHCKIDDLALVNFFVGENNSCKSTILDAIYIGCEQSQGDALRYILSKRINRKVGGSELWFGYNPQNKIEIYLKLKNGREYLTAFFKSGNEIEYIIGLYDRQSQLVEIDEEGTGMYRFSDIYLIRTAKLSKIPQYFREVNIIFSLVHESELRNEIEGRLGKIKLNLQLEKDLIKRASECYQDIKYEFIPMSEAPANKLLAIQQENYRVFIDFNGDGVKRGLVTAIYLGIIKKYGVTYRGNRNPSTPESLAKIS